MKQIHTSALLVLFCILGFITTAQVSWQKLPTPNDYVKGIGATSNNNVYAGTSTYGVFKSADAGVTWSNISLGLADSSIRELCVSSTDEIFVGTAQHGIYKYNGTSWLQINTGLPSGNALVIGFAKGISGEMYVAISTGAVYKWNGTTWVNLTYNLAAPGIMAIATGPTGTVYVGAYGSGVFKFDGVSNWTSFGTGFPSMYVVDIVVSSTDTVYAGTPETICRLPSGGGTWVQVNSGLPAGISALGIDAQNRLYSCNYITDVLGNYGQIYRSANGGNSWSFVSGSLYTHFFWSFCYTPSGNIYAGGSGVYKSTDHGDTWNDMNPGLDARKSIACFTGKSDGTLFLGTTTFGVWRSTDNGNTWQQKTVGLTAFNSIQITTNAAGDILYSANYGSSSRIFRSTDNGDSWSQVAANGTDQYTKIKQHNADTIWATERFQGPTNLSFSVDNGATWANNPLHISAIWDIDCSHGSTIFIGSESEGVSRSLDGGQTWTLGVGNSIPWYGNVIAVETDATGYIFAGSDWYQHVLWFSDPASNGDAWTEFTDPDLDITTVFDVVFDINNNAYLATKSGVYMAYNSVWNVNTDWIPSSSGLPGQAWALQFGFDASGYIYSVIYSANGHNAGLFRSTAVVNGCNAPTNISASNITSTKATINWTGNGGAAKYRVQYRVQGTATWTTKKVTAPIVTKTISSLQPVTTYEYHVRTDCNSTGTLASAYSSIQTFTTVCSCAKPANITITNVSQTSATVNWTGNSCAIQYLLQYRKQGTSAWTKKTITAPTQLYNITGLTANSIYEYRLRSDCNSTGSVNSGWTTIATFSTLQRLADTEISSTIFYVAPNPCSTCFVGGVNNEMDLVVTDLAGRTVIVQFTKSTNGIYINMPETSAGLYIIRNLKTGEIIKFVKE
ncbi:MAG TPA: fibronectin type III domain-containing protein [Chitinophagales bacterium]|nr:fibronectin type III domain-containing protein [Chitinophagales bacterium]